MSDATCTARSVMEAAANAALARYLQAVGDGARRQIAEAAYRDHILKAWDRTQPWAAEQARRERDRTALDDAIRHRAILEDELSAIAVRKLRETAGAR